MEVSSNELRQRHATTIPSTSADDDLSKERMDRRETRQLVMQMRREDRRRMQEYSTGMQQSYSPLLMGYVLLI